MSVTAEIPLAHGGLYVALFGDSVDATYTNLGIPIDLPNEYPGFTAGRWEFVHDASATTQSHTISIVDETNAVYATTTISAGVTARTRGEVSFTPAGNHTYSIKITGSVADPYSFLLIKSILWLRVVNSTAVKVQILLVDGQNTSGGAGVFDDGAADNDASWNAKGGGAAYGAHNILFPNWLYTSANWLTVTSIVWRSVVKVGGGTGTISLFDTSNNQLVASEQSTVSTSATTLSVTLTSSFTNATEYNIQFKTTGGNLLFFYSSALYFTLNCSEKCEIYIPSGTSELVCIGSGFYDLGGRVKINSSYFSGTTFYHEATALQVGTATTQSTYWMDDSTFENGIVGVTTVGSSQLTSFPTSPLTRQRSPAITLTDGDRFMQFATEGPAPFAGLSFGLPLFIVGILVGPTCTVTEAQPLFVCATPAVLQPISTSVVAVTLVNACTEETALYPMSTGVAAVTLVDACVPVTALTTISTSVTAVCTDPPGQIC